MSGFIIIVGLILGFAVFIGMLSSISGRIGKRKRFNRIPHTVTEGELRTQKAMEAALRNTQQKQPAPASPASLSTRLRQLDEALRAGLITQQDYDKKRADIIASA